MSTRATLAALAFVVAACSGAVAPTPTQSPATTASPVATPVLTLAPATEAPTPTSAPTPTPEPPATPPPTPTQAPTETPAESPASSFSLTSTAFAEGEPIPAEFTCDGADSQLPVAWGDVPDGTVELALVMHDPDAGGFVHWVVVAIPPDATALEDPLPEGARHGRNDFGQARYNGPCPPSGNHAYVTTLFALSAPLDLGPTPDGRAVRQAAQSVAIATAVLNGTYRRT